MYVNIFFRAVPRRPHSRPPGSALPQFGTRSILGGEIRRLRLPRKVVETTSLAAPAPTAFSNKNNISLKKLNVL